jgi:hypothetical protein
LVPLKLIRKLAAGNGGIITSPSLKQAILALAASTVVSLRFSETCTQYVRRACSEIRLKNPHTIDDADLSAIYILTLLQRDERPIHARGMVTVLSLLSQQSSTQLQSGQGIFSPYRTISFDYASSIPTGHTGHTNIRQELYRNLYFRFPTVEDRMSCYFEFLDRNDREVDRSVCTSLCHHLSRLLDLLYQSTEIGEQGFLEQPLVQLLLRDAEIELSGPEYVRIFDLAKKAPKELFDLPSMGVLPLNCILYLGVQLLLSILGPSTSSTTGEDNIIFGAMMLVDVLRKARITVYVNSRRGPWLSSLLLLSALILPQEYCIYSLANTILCIRLMGL